MITRQGYRGWAGLGGGEAGLLVPRPHPGILPPLRSGQPPPVLSLPPPRPGARAHQQAIGPAAPPGGPPEDHEDDDEEDEEDARSCQHGDDPILGIFRHGRSIT